MKIEISKKDLLKLGMLICECGYPKNNHFPWGKKTCAHNNKCTGYKEKLTHGKIIK